MGANRAERAPTTTRASPLRIMRQASCRWASVMRLWRTATCPKRPRNQPTVWGVSAISGTRTIAPRPAARTSSITER